MLKRFVLAVLAFCLVLGGQSNVALAISSDIVISQVQAGSVSSSRLVEIYNNSDRDVDLTGWSIYRSPASDSNPTEVYRFNVADAKTRIILPAWSYIGIVSTQAGKPYDANLIVSMGNGISGHIYLRDSKNAEVDRVAWGLVSDPSNTPKNPEGAQIELGASKVIERRSSGATSVLVDSDNNSDDFFQSTLRTTYLYDSWYEADDWCSNLTGIQSTVPEGDVYYEEDNSCSPPPVDICRNIEGTQVNLPNGYGQNDEGYCLPDLCINLEGDQFTVPEGYRAEDQDCLLDLPELVVNELLPNPEGDDVASEYIEIYNPNDFIVSLDKYAISVGTDVKKSYDMPLGMQIMAGNYLVIGNNIIKYTLTNTSSKVALVTVDGQKISESDIYTDAKDDMSWSLIGGIWQYTNQLTPGRANLLSLEGTVLSATNSTLKPCASNQYRNPDTNRCRLTASSPTLTPCKDGQYRSEETSRCRNIAEDAGLTPCADGQERNPDTNRCRNVLGAMTTAPFAVEPVAVKQTGKLDMLVLGGVIILAIAYALWEWRVEFNNLAAKLKRLLSKTKIH